MLRRIVLVSLLLAFPFAAQAQVPGIGAITSALKDPLIGMLTNSLGVTENQATGGVGSILTLAKERLAAGDFDQLASVIPGASKYMAAAKSLGAVKGPVANRAGLDSALGRLGMNADTIGKMLPAVTDFAETAGGDSTRQLLASVLE